TREGTITSSSPRIVGSIGGVARTVTAQLSPRSTRESTPLCDARLGAAFPFRLTSCRRGSQVSKSPSVISGIVVAMSPPSRLRGRQELVITHNSWGAPNNARFRSQHNREKRACLWTLCTNYAGG